LTNPVPPPPPQQPFHLGQMAQPPRKRRLWPWLLAGGAAFTVLLVCGIAGIAVLANLDTSEPGVNAAAPGTDTAGDSDAPDDSTQEEQPATPTEVAVGETLTITGTGFEGHYTIIKVEQVDRDEFGLRPEHGTYLLAHMKVEIVEGSTFVCSCETAFVQAGGRVHEETFASIKGKPMFESAELAAGQNTDGWIVFDVPKDTVDGGKIQLTLQNFWTDNEYGYWTL